MEIKPEKERFLNQIFKLLCTSNIDGGEGGVGEGVCRKILKGKLFLLLFVVKQGHPASTK